MRTDAERFTSHTLRLVHTRRSWKGYEPVVYYAQVGRLIKIGSSLSPKERVRYFGRDTVLLATEPGGRPVEGKRLRQFAAYRLPGETEWFFPRPALVAHIAAVATGMVEAEPVPASAVVVVPARPPGQLVDSIADAAARLGTDPRAVRDEIAANADEPRKRSFIVVGDVRVPVLRIGRSWMVAAAPLDAALRGEAKASA